MSAPEELSRQLDIDRSSGSTFLHSSMTIETLHNGVEPRLETLERLSRFLQASHRSAASAQRRAMRTVTRPAIMAPHSLSDTMIARRSVLSTTYLRPARKARVAGTLVPRACLSTTKMLIWDAYKNSLLRRAWPRGHRMPRARGGETPTICQNCEALVDKKLEARLGINRSGARLAMAAIALAALAVIGDWLQSIPDLVRHIGERRKRQVAQSAYSRATMSREYLDCAKQYEAAARTSLRLAEVALDVAKSTEDSLRATQSSLLQPTGEACATSTTGQDQGTEQSGGCDLKQS